MSTHVAPELLEEAKRLREALREIEQATEGIPEQNCMLANRIARVALRDTAPSDYERFKASSPENAALLDAEERVLAAEQRAAEAEAALRAILHAEQWADVVSIIDAALCDPAPTHPRPGVPSLLAQARATLTRSLSEVVRLAEEKRGYAPTDAIGDARVEAVEEGP